MGTLKRLKQCERTIQLTLDFMKNSTKVIPFPYQVQFFNYFFKENNQLSDDILNLLKEEDVGIVAGFLNFMSNLSGEMNDELFGPNRTKMKKVDAIYSLQHILKYIQKGISRGKNLRVFYSWQSDSLNTTNRTFIEGAINKAIKRINEKENINLYLDQDTRDVPGSPDVIRAILEKIDNSLVFIGDVSIVFRNEIKAFPNANVMLETGYAISSLGDEKIIMVFNTDSGYTNELPFDLGLKRQLKYNCDQSISPLDKKDEKQRLTNDLENAILTILKLEIG